MSDHLHLSVTDDAVSVQWKGEDHAFKGPNAHLEFIEWANRVRIPECIVVVNGEADLWTDWLLKNLARLNKEHEGVRR